MYLTAITGSMDSTLYAAYSSNDLRKQGYYAGNSDGYTYFKGSYAASDYDLFTGIATDELFLIRSECYIRAGLIQKGLNDLNTLLAKRYISGSFVPLAIQSQSDALDTVLMERKKELVMRGLRWMDLKRLNKEGKNIVLERIINRQSFTLQPNANYYALPLPEDIIQLTGMHQNEP